MSSQKLVIRKRLHNKEHYGRHQHCRDKNDSHFRSVSSNTVYVKTCVINEIPCKKKSEINSVTSYTKWENL